MPGCKSTSPIAAISSIRSHTVSPSSPSCNDGKGEVPLCEFVPPLFVVLHLPMIWQKHYSSTICSYQVHWIPKVHDRCKGLEILVSARTKTNNELACRSQHSKSCWACLHTTYRLILQAHGCCSLRQKQYPKDIFPLVTTYGRRIGSSSISLSADIWINHTFAGLLNDNI